GRVPGLETGRAEVGWRAGAGGAELETLRGRLEGLKRQETELESRAEEVGAEALRLAGEERSKGDHAATLAARLKTLEELKASFEGFEAGVRALFKDGRRGSSRGVVADLLEVPREWVDALEVFLGPALQAVIVDTDA